MELGEININSLGTPMKIIKIRNSSDIDIEFEDEHHFIKTHCTYGNFKRGTIKNPYDKSICNIGCLGNGKYIRYTASNKPTNAYNIWKQIIERCYGINSEYKYRSYYGISECCLEWLNFQNFAEWYENNKYAVIGRLHIDKDILYPGNKIYSPYHCLLVPQRINMLFTNKPNKRGLPNGIKTNGNKYYVEYNKIKLGCGNTIEEAYQLYAKYKKAEIIKVANEYKEIVPQKVYEALLNYEVRIENDKNYFR